MENEKEAAWDEVDWDEKLEKAQKALPVEELTTSLLKEFGINPKITGCTTKENEDGDGNYFEDNQNKRRMQQERPSHVQKKTKESAESMYIQPYSVKDIDELAKKQSTEVVLIIYYELDRLLATYHLNHLTDEAVVGLLCITVNLLNIPFYEHSLLLLEELSKALSFWQQLTHFLDDFLSSKQKEVKFLLLTDMNSFFANLELFFQNLVINNRFGQTTEALLHDIITIFERHADSQWLKTVNLQQILKDQADKMTFYDIYPTLAQLNDRADNLQAILLKGCYENVDEYLRVQLPLLKEDFMNKLRDGISQMKLMEDILDKYIIRTSNIVIFPNVQIKIMNRWIYNTNCKMMAVQLNAEQRKSINWNKRFFNGQLLCFTSSRDMKDLIVAVVMNRLSEKSKDEKFDTITIEIIRTEGIDEILDKELIMIEPSTFFEPYHRVHNAMKNLNKHNFPFKSQIIEMADRKQFPSYEHANNYVYNDFEFNVVKLNEWPTHQQLKLEDMQLKAVQAAITNELQIIQGTPGSGKTFIGVEILKILLENTSETILVLTQTNAALDRFLMGAAKFTESIARLGGQSKCDELEKFTIKPSSTVESSRYLKKLQTSRRNAILKLTQSNENPDEIHRSIFRNTRLIEEVQQLCTFFQVQTKRVIGMTTTFAARNCAINHLLKPGIVIVEEASEVLESHVVVSLTTSTKQLIMIGDHQQLRPQTNSYELVKKFNFNFSLFERFVNNGVEFVTLNVQMRMRPEFCDLVRGIIYKDLKDGNHVLSYPNVKGMSHNFFCLNHSHPESVGINETSKENLFEAEYVVKLCNHLLESGNTSEDITILTAYAAQAQLIRRHMKNFEKMKRVRVAILDAYQGEESNIILLSLVRSNDRNDIGFLSIENRIAVILTRAKIGFYIVGNMGCLARASHIWKKACETMKFHHAIDDELPSDFGIDL